MEWLVGMGMFFLAASSGPFFGQVDGQHSATVVNHFQNRRLGFRVRHELVGLAGCIEWAGCVDIDYVDDPVERITSALINLRGFDIKRSRT